VATEGRYHVGREAELKHRRTVRAPGVSETLRLERERRSREGGRPTVRG
jgi:hypothetical protein